MVVTAMGDWCADAEIQDEGCQAVHLLATGHAACRTRVVEAGAVTVVRHALTRFHSNPSIVQAGRQALNVLTIR